MNGERRDELADFLFTFIACCSINTDGMAWSFVVVVVVAETDAACADEPQCTLNESECACTASA